MGNYFESIKKDVQSAIEKAMEDIFEQVEGSSIYSMALVTDSDFITLYLAANTEAHMREKDLMYAEDMVDFYSANDIDSVKAGNSSFTKWIPAEWGYSDGNNSELNKISKILYDMEANDTKLYSEKNDEFLEMVSECFEKAINNCVDTNRDDIVFFISVSDDERASAIENYSAKRLNSNDVAERLGKGQL